MTIDSQEQLERLIRVGGVVAAVCRLMGSRLEPGMTTKELDEIGRAALELEGCRSAPQLMYDFPGATCISINHAVAHGIPDDTKIQPGDMVNIDVSAEREGVCLVLGSEGQGLSETALRACRPVAIPMPGEMESLNVGVAGGILMYLMRKER